MRAVLSAALLLSGCDAALRPAASPPEPASGLLLIPAPLPAASALAPAPAPAPAPGPEPADEPDPRYPPATCRQDRSGALLLPDTPGPREPASPLLGRVAVTTIQTPIRAHFACLRRCYERGLARDPALRGKIAVRFRIARDTGLVTEARSDQSELPDEEVVACVVDEFKGIRFPAPPRDIQVVYPLTFSPR